MERNGYKPYYDPVGFFGYQNTQWFEQQLDAITRWRDFKLSPDVRQSVHDHEERMQHLAIKTIDCFPDLTSQMDTKSELPWGIKLHDAGEINRKRGDFPWTAPNHEQLYARIKEWERRYLNTGIKLYVKDPKLRRFFIDLNNRLVYPQDSDSVALYIAWLDKAEAIDFAKVNGFTDQLTQRATVYGRLMGEKFIKSLSGSLQTDIAPFIREVTTY